MVLRHSTTTAARPQKLNPPQPSRLPRAIVLCGAVLLVGASACLGAFFGFQVGAHIHWTLGAIFALAALGGELLKPFAVVATLDAFKRWELGRGSMLALLSIACVVYSLAAELSLSAGTRGDLAAERQAQTTKATMAKARYDRALANLNQLAPPASTDLAQLHTEKARLLSIKGVECDANKDSDAYGPISRKHCPRITAIEAQINISIQMNNRRTVLETEVAVAGAAMRVLSVGVVTEKKADPLASALAVYGTALGFTITAGQLAPWLYLIPVMFLELGSALGFVLVRAFNYTPACANERKPVSRVSQPRKHRTTAVPTTPLKTQETLGDQGVDHADHCDDTDDEDSDGGTRAVVLSKLHENGGQFHGSQRGLAALIGMSKTTVQRVLKELVADGLVVVRSSQGHGTKVALA